MKLQSKADRAKVPMFMWRGDHVFTCWEKGKTNIVFQPQLQVLRSSRDRKIYVVHRMRQMKNKKSPILWNPNVSCEWLSKNRAGIIIWGHSLEWYSEIWADGSYWRIADPFNILLKIWDGNVISSHFLLWCKTPLVGLPCGRNYSKFGFGTLRDKDLQEKQALKRIISLMDFSHSSFWKTMLPLFII